MKINTLRENFTKIPTERKSRERLNPNQLSVNETLLENEVNDLTSRSPVPLSKIKSITEDLNEQLNDNQKSVQFEIDTESEKVIIKIVDQETNKVLRRIPDFELEEFSLSKSPLKGQLVDEIE